MNDLISREALLENAQRMTEYDEAGWGVPVRVVKVEHIENAPAVDAVPVVRCKDCKHYELDACLKIYQDGNVSNDAWQERKPTDFCSYAERKE